MYALIFNYLSSIIGTQRKRERSVLEHEICNAYVEIRISIRNVSNDKLFSKLIFHPKTLNRIQIPINPLSERDQQFRSLFREPVFTKEEEEEKERSNNTRTCIKLSNLIWKITSTS